LGNVLVLVPGHVVAAINASPVNLFGEDVNGGEGVILRLELTSGESSLSDTASTISERLLFTRVLGLGEWVDSLVVVGIILLLLSGGVDAGPVVNGDSPIAVRFNVEVVNTSDDSEETLLTPVGAPRVTNSPELDTVLNTVTNNGNNVVGIQESSLIVEDTTIVVIKGLVGSDLTSEGTTLVKFVLNSRFASDVAVLLNVVFVVLLGDDASFTGSAVSAVRHSRATNTVVPASTLVDGASLIGDVVVEHPFVGVGCITTVAAVVFLLAGDDELNGQVNVWPLSITGDLDSIRQG
jgi:hypothetical protein